MRYLKKFLFLDIDFELTNNNGLFVFAFWIMEWLGIDIYISYKDRDVIKNE